MGRLWWGYGDERAVGDAGPPIPPNSEEPRRALRPDPPATRLKGGHDVAKAVA